MKKKILITGSSGYTGQGIAEVLAQRFYVRGLDLVSNSACSENFIGSITDESLCLDAVQGCDGVVLCHMAPRPSSTTYLDYNSSSLALDINVKGTANMYEAIVKKKVPRVVMISSAGILNDFSDNPEVGVGPYGGDGSLYCLCKKMQEMLAQFFFCKHNVVTTVLRPSWIVYDGSMQTKYGQKLDSYSPNLIDPRDLGRIAANLLEDSPATLDGYFVGQLCHDPRRDHIYTKLGIVPQYTFDRLQKPS